MNLLDRTAMLLFFFFGAATAFQVGQITLSSHQAWLTTTTTTTALNFGRGRGAADASRLQPLTASAASSSDNSKINKEDQQPWIQPAAHNSNSFRVLALLGALAAAAAWGGERLSLGSAGVQAAARTVHFLSFGTWFGTMTYTTFVVGFTLFQALPRKVFGTVQSKLFPKYFMTCSVTLLLQLATLSSLGLGGGGVAAWGIRSFRALGLGLIMTLLNQWYLEPTATKCMFDRYRLDDVPGGPQSEEYKRLKANFGKLHGMSSLVNLVALCTGVAHAVFLAMAGVNGGGMALQ